MTDNNSLTSKSKGRKKTKKKVFLITGSIIIALALGGWLFFHSYLSWKSFDDIFPNYTVTWQEEDKAFYVSVYGMFDIVFHTTEPTAYVKNEPIAMQHGIRIKNGQPYFNILDANVFNDGLNNALTAISSTDNSAPVGVIVNGLYGQGTQEQNEMIQSLLGEQAREQFEVYFQWYNVIHELGHLITTHHGTYDSDDMSIRHMVDEEMLVNSFAVAFWTLYGEEEKIEALEVMVDYVLSNITPPVDHMSHLDYMREAVDNQRMAEVFTFESYGWFQFSMVRDLLRIRGELDLESLLSQMCGRNVQIQPHQRLNYPALGKDMVPEVVADVVTVLHGWGIDVPDVYITYSTDPNEHMLHYPFSRVLLESNIENGRIARAYR